MARSRNIKPGFFANDELAEIEPLGRLLFAGLWTIADREGRLEDRPKKIKASVLAYDECDVEGLLDRLAAGGFIVRYTVDGVSLIQVTTWTRHQNPHKNEPPSTLAACKNASSTVQEREQNSSDREDSSPKTTDSSPKTTDHRAQGARAVGSARIFSESDETKISAFVAELTRRGVDHKPTSADNAAIVDSPETAEFLAEAFSAALAGRWGDEWLQKNLEVRWVANKLPAYRLAKRSGFAKNGRTASADLTSEEQEAKYRGDGTTAEDEAARARRVLANNRATKETKHGGINPDKRTDDTKTGRSGDGLLGGGTPSGPPTLAGQ